MLTKQQETKFLKMANGGSIRFVRLVGTCFAWSGKRKKRKYTKKKTTGKRRLASLERRVEGQR